MADPIRTAQIPHATSLLVSDRVVVIRDPEGTPFTRSALISDILAFGATTSAGSLLGTTLAANVTSSNLLSAAGGTFGTAAFVNTSAFQATNAKLTAIAALANAAGVLTNDGSGNFSWGAGGGGAGAAGTLTGTTLAANVIYSSLTTAAGGTFGTAAYTASTAYDAAGAAAAVTPTTLGLVIGTNTQAYSAKLTAIHNLASAAAWLKNDGAGNFSYSTPTAANVGAEASGSVSTHAAVTTGVHGLAITAGQVLTVTTGGTLGSAAYTASTAYAPAAGSPSIVTTGTVTSGTWSASFGAVSGANLTSLTAGNLSGTIPSAVLGNSTHYVGTTAIALNRASASLALTGITSIDGSSASCTGNAATTSQRAFSGDISTTGQGRFTGWYAGSAATGLAVEVGISGGEGYVITYDRVGSVYGALNIGIGTASMRFASGVTNVNVGVLQQGGNQVLHAGNYTSYSPTLTGGSASGTWGISVTGNAAGLSASSKIMVAETAYNWHSWAARSNAATDCNFSLQRNDGAGLGGIYADASSIGFLTAAGSWIAAWTKATGAMVQGSVPYSLLSGTVPTWNQNTTGSAASCTGLAAQATTVMGAAQSNITSVGTLTSLSVAGAVGITGVVTVIYSAALPTLGEILFGNSGKSLYYNGTALSWDGNTIIHGGNVSSYGFPAGNLTGTTISASVTTASLTTLSSLATVGTITSGTWSASFGAVSGANLTSLTAGNLTGTIPSSVLGTSSMYIGTSSFALNRPTGSIALTGVTNLLKVGTRTAYIRASDMWPRMTNGCSALTVSESGATTYPNYRALYFDANTEEFAHFEWCPPKAYDGSTLGVTMVYSTPNGNPGSVVMAMRAVFHRNNDQGSYSWGMDLPFSTVNPPMGTLSTGISGELSFTVGGAYEAGGCIVRFEIHRKVSDPGDGYGSDFYLHGIRIRYSENAVDDA